MGGEGRRLALLTETKTKTHLSAAVDGWRVSSQCNVSHSLSSPRPRAPPTEAKDEWRERGTERHRERESPWGEVERESGERADAIALLIKRQVWCGLVCARSSVAVGAANLKGSPSKREG